MDISGEELSIGRVNIVKLLMVREKSVRYQKPFCTADTVVNAVRPMFKGSYREIVVVVGMDNSNCPTVIHTVGVGSPNQSVVCMASIFKPILLANSVSFVLCHNHLCDQMNSSQADRDLTDKIGDIAKMLELHFLDHLILNADGTEYFSFRKMGMLKA